MTETSFIQVADRHLPLLRSNGLDSWAAIMSFAGGETMRSVPGRSTVRLELRRSDGSSQIAFLKRYESSYLSLWKRWLRLTGLPEAQDEAMHEWQMIHRLQECGILVPEPMAVGQEKHRGIVTRSFLMTAQVIDGVAAHEQFKGLAGKERRRMLDHVAELTRRFHSAGFIHKDYYLNHILMVPPFDQPRLFLIDLQRARGPGRFRRRWVVKDLAALLYALQLTGATHTDGFYFLKAYLGARPTGASERRLISRVDRRVKWLHRRRPKHDVIWDRPGIRPSNV